MHVDWIPLFVLPNLVLRSPIECDLVALVPADDHRVVSLKREQPMFCAFLSRFSDTFGETFEPTVLLLREDAPPSFLEIETLAGFRDLTAVSVVALHRARELSRPRGLRVLYGDAFAFYPWMLDKRNDGLVASTPDFRGFHDLNLFNGQSFASVARKSLDLSDIDRTLFTALTDRWCRRFDAIHPESDGHRAFPIFEYGLSRVADAGGHRFHAV